MARLLEVDDLRVTFRGKDGDAYAVRGVGFHLDEGMSLGIVGESGSGKSVTSQALMGLLPTPFARIEARKLEFAGRDLARLSRRELQSQRGTGMAMIFQEPMTSLDPVFTVGNQLAETLVAKLGMQKKAAMLRSAELLSRVEIPDPHSVLACYPHQLSGGMRQRVMIAMAISCNPRILIADEPTTALDVTIQSQVLGLIKDLQKDSGTALVMITHDMGVIAETTDRVVVMYGGLVMENSGVRELFADPVHPYTKALLASIPRADADPSQRLYSIPGGSPSASDPPSGCPFHPRCPLADSRCAAELPAERPIGSDRSARCWRLA